MPNFFFVSYPREILQNKQGLDKETINVFQLNTIFQKFKTNMIMEDIRSALFWTSWVISCSICIVMANFNYSLQIFTTLDLHVFWLIFKPTECFFVKNVLILKRVSRSKGNVIHIRHTILNWTLYSLTK